MAAVLRKMEESDLPIVLNWRNDERVRVNMYTDHVISPEEHAAWWARESDNSASRLLIAEIEGSAIGVVIFTKYTGKAGIATWAFYAGENAPKGAGSQMETAALDYAFGVLQVRKLECEVLSFNKSVISLHLRHGFSVEGIFREAYVRSGTPHDIYRLALLSKDWFKYVESAVKRSVKGRIGLAGQMFTKTLVMTREMVDGFSLATGDNNPIHLDDTAARAAEFDGCIAHGMLAGGLFSAIFANDFPGSGTIYMSQSLVFKRPVAVGAEVELSLRVLSHIGRKMLVETELYCQGQCCVTGQAELLSPKDIAVKVLV